MNPFHSTPSKGHRRYATDPGMTFTAMELGLGIGKNGTFDDLDMDFMAPTFHDESVFTPFAQRNKRMVEDNMMKVPEENITGMKHLRDNDKTNIHPPPTMNASLKKMESEDVMEMFPNPDNAIYDSVIPALGSMSMDTLDLLKVNSEDWLDSSWNQQENAGEGSINSPPVNRQPFKYGKGSGSSTSGNTSGNRSGESSPNTQLLNNFLKQQRYAQMSRSSSGASGSYVDPPLKSMKSTNQTPFANTSSSGNTNTTRVSRHTTAAHLSSSGTGGGGHSNKTSINLSSSSHNNQNHNTANRLGSGISDTEIHLPRKPILSSHSTDEDMLEDERNKANNLNNLTNRGKYRCGRCGQPKVNHVCPFVAEVSMRSIGTQMEPSHRIDNTNHPFLTERTISVGGKLPMVKQPMTPTAIR